jgi:O-antigen ligase
MIEAKTAWVCLVISSGIVLGLGFAGFRKYLGVCLSAGLVLFFFLELSFNISESIVATLGRDTTLTGRTDLWPLVLALATNPMIGAGFESFWLGERLSTLQDALFFKPTQAHNGYIEIYINLGWIGLLLLAGTIISSYRAMRKTLVLSLKTECREAAEFARLGMGFLIAYHIFNFTDALFKPISLLFVFFLIFAMRWPPSRPASHCLTSGNSQGIPQVASTVMAK